MKNSILYGFAACNLWLAAANAAGTYMGTSGYASPQKYYQGASSNGYYQPQNRGTSGSGSYYQQRGGYQQAGSGYARQGAEGQGNYAQGNYSAGNNYYGNSARQSGASTGANRGSPQTSGGDGFYLDAGLSHQYAKWNFDMNETGSVLDYSDVAWNVLDVKAGYQFGGWVIGGGLQYGMQSGKSIMTDDDITNGGEMTGYCADLNGNNVCDSGEEGYAKTLSIGESSGGSLFGMNAGIGLANKLGWGKTKITPSVGYRMFNYKLNTKNNHGLSVSDNWCYNDNGTTYCPAYIWTSDGTNSDLTGPYLVDQNGNYSGWFEIPGGRTNMVTDSYSFSQPDNTHIYDVSWDGPYIAADFQSELNESNRIDARIEFGLPGYNAKGDQPYRFDWMHPNSIEDKKDIFGAYHIGFLASWTSMISQSWGITAGLTWDYYSVSGADATTNLNGDYYLGLLQQIFDNGVANGLWTDDLAGQDMMYANDPTAAAIGYMYESCGESWTCVSPGEVNSFYRSIGIRVGLIGKF